jgi:hypothetical protein
MGVFISVCRVSWKLGNPHDQRSLLERIVETVTIENIFGTNTDPDHIATMILDTIIAFIIPFIEYE